MIHWLIILLLLVANIFVIRKLGPLKESFASGIELTLTGGFLAGYWFGFKWGILISMLFMLGSYVASLSFSPTMFVTTPLSSLVGIAGAMAATSGLSVTVLAIGSIVAYSVISDLIIYWLMGSEYFASCIITDLGSLGVNVIFFHVFF